MKLEDLTREQVQSCSQELAKNEIAKISFKLPWREEVPMMIKTKDHERIKASRLLTLQTLEVLELVQTMGDKNHTNLICYIEFKDSGRMMTGYPMFYLPVYSSLEDFFCTPRDPNHERTQTRLG